MIRTRSIITGGLTVLVGSACLGTAADAAQPQHPAAATSAVAPAKDIGSRMVALTNAERTKRGLRPLTRITCLNGTAQKWSATMNARQQLVHSNLSTWMRTCRLNRAAENIAMGGGTPERTVQMWMKSPGHRANILDPALTKIGVGWSGKQSWATQQFG